MKSQDSLVSIADAVERFRHETQGMDVMLAQMTNADLENACGELRLHCEFLLMRLSVPEAVGLDPSQQGMIMEQRKRLASALEWIQGWAVRTEEEDPPREEGNGRPPSGGPEFGSPSPRAPLLAA